MSDRPEGAAGADAAIVGIRRAALSTDLAAAVAELIRQRRLGPGDAIPALRPLAEQFGVAVPTMREALRRLEGMGILEFRHGSGIYVGPNANRLVVANAMAPRPTKAKLQELLSARLLIEPAIAGQAAQRREPAALAALQEALATARSFIGAAAPLGAAADRGLAEANVRIHQAIAAVTGNSVLAETVDTWASLHARDQAEILMLHGDPEQDYAEHAELVACIAGGRWQLAQRKMRDHLAGVLATITEAGEPT
ncbi:FadR/GntR family transcriptional regulator [Nakamurella aerolata]|uniref:FadR family transcriptional regulator n=1 Tax=Nakamurella aerolata TaxID=1656892 RepID=A0A849A5V0_9ACTN|nr:GntR family transcriptional regulator [Nakamurella aerolata]NNG34763.1 FadR family transcriptional regulator [Nakamurella aerolata]